MRTETSEAYARLVTTFVIAIEETGTELPNDLEQRLSTNPLKACELLNELALSCGAIDDQTDNVLAAIYASMDAADARTPADELAQARISRALARAHRERPVPEPEPAQDQAEEPQATESATSPDDAPAREARETKPKRRTRKSQAKNSEKNAPAQGKDAEAAKGNATVAADATPEQATLDLGAETTSSTSTEPETPAEPEAAAETVAAPSAESPAQDTPEAESGDAAAKSQPATATALDPNDVLTVDQTIAILGVSRPTIYKLIESGKLPAFKKGRSWQISASAVAAMAAK